MSYFSVGRRFHCIWFQRLISNLIDRNVQFRRLISNVDRNVHFRRLISNLIDRNVHFRRLISSVDRNFPNSKKVGPTMFDVAAQDSISFEEQNPKNK
jgi:hypothetical protein